MFKRSLPLSHHPAQSFFLWGPRQTGKSTLLRSLYPHAIWIDLLKAEEYRRYVEHPEWLRTEILPSQSARLVVIDEVQKVPKLLDEAHWLIENEQIVFVLCGSSARKVKRGHANLLGGRAIRYELFGLVSSEIGKDFDLNRMLNNGYLPKHYLTDRPQRLIESYVSEYLKEEIAAEGLTRNLPTFSRFLSIAAFSDTELVNFSTIARDCGISSHTIRSYFEILTDTLIGRWLPAYRKREKRRVITAPKFYFVDVGIVNNLVKRRQVVPGSEVYGKAFENWVFHELSAFNEYSEEFADLYYWRLASGIEVDFVLGKMETAIEAKAVTKVTSDHLNGLRNIHKEYPELKNRIVVCLESKERKTEDGIRILPATNFARKLWTRTLY